MMVHFGSGTTDSERVTKEHIRDVSHALERYRLDSGRYPSTAEGLDALTSRPARAGAHWRPLLSNLPQDGWGHPFRYSCPTTQASYEVRSAGADGQFDTRDDMTSPD